MQWPHSGTKLLASHVLVLIIIIIFFQSCILSCIFSVASTSIIVNDSANKRFCKRLYFITIILRVANTVLQALNIFRVFQSIYRLNVFPSSVYSNITKYFNPSLWSKHFDICSYIARIAVYCRIFQYHRATKELFDKHCIM